MNKLTALARRLLTKSLRDRKGAVSIMMAFTFTAVLGFVGLGTEASYWYVTKRSMQGAADAAAFTAAAALMNGETITGGSGTPVTAADAIATTYGFTGGDCGTSVATVICVNNPPTSGPNTGNTTAVEVIITQQQSGWLTSFFVPNPTITSRAVAAKLTTSTNACTTSNGTNGSCGCVLALDKGDVVDITDSGNATVNTPGCSTYVNSDDPSAALSMSGNMTVNSYSTYVVGGVWKTGNAQLNTEVGPNGSSSSPNGTNGAYTNTGVPQADPNLGISPPTSGNCMTAAINGNNQPTILYPGTYCGGITINQQSNVTFMPGTYVIAGGSGVQNTGLQINGGATVTGQGVSFYLTNSGGTSTNYATVQINGNSTITLNTDANTNSADAPPLGGTTFFQDRNAPTASTGNTATTTNTFNGTASMNIGGDIYFPNQKVVYTGGSAQGTSGSAACTRLISYQIKFTGNTNFNNACKGYGINYFGAGGPVTSSVALVE